MTPEEMERYQAEKAQKEANRDAYLLRKHGADGLWKLQQQWLGQMAQLRPDLKERFRLKSKPVESSNKESI